jgi:hypothetical protein
LASAAGMWFALPVANLYLVMMTDGRTEEISADFYERDGEDWVFLSHMNEVYRIKIDDVVSVAKAPKDLV